MYNIWIINLDKNQERMKIIQNNMDSLGISFNRFSAIYGKDNLSNPKITNLCKYLLCNPGIIGCGLSHRKLWEKLANSDQDAYFIIEDDVLLTKETINILKKIPPYIEKYNIDILSLNCLDTTRYLKSPYFEIDNVQFVKPIFPLGTSAYIITKNCAKKLNKIMSNIYYHVDNELSINSVLENINYFCSKKPVVDISEYYYQTTIGVRRRTILLFLLDSFGLSSVGWMLNVPLYTFFLKYEINLLFILVFSVFLINIFFIKNKILFAALLIELCLIMKQN